MVGEPQEPRIGLVHDYLLVMRGAERTFAAIADSWPGAPIWTLLYDEKGTRRTFAEHEVHSSYLRRLRVGQSGFRKLLPLFPRAVERLDLSDRDAIVSSSSAFAHGVRPAPGTLHVCYCHSPFRYAWHECERALAETPRLLRPLVRRSLARIRRWDLEASTRVTHYIANSLVTQRRIEEFYGRDSTIIHPPVEVERFRMEAPEDYFVIVGEVVGHKRTELALDAARRAGVRLKVVGTGPELERLTALHNDHAEFCGRLKDVDVVDLYARARGAIVPNVEEFGIAAVEAQAAGLPVVALAAGGTGETVIDGETGVLVQEPTLDAFAEALRHTDFDRFSNVRIREHAAANFSTGAFIRKLRSEVGRLMNETAERPLAAV